MRTITLIVVHCSAVRPDQSSSAAQIDSWHRKERHWKLGIGYHYVVRRDGTIEPGRPEEQIGAHCLNHNTAEQKQAMRQLLEELHGRYPRAIIVGHHDLNPGKNCPCYDVAREYTDLQPH